MLEELALAIIIFVVITLFYGIIAIHDIPYEIAKSRGHPHQDAIHIAGWVSLFTLHVLWPFLWIWATLYRPDRGWGFSEKHHLVERVKKLETLLLVSQENNNQYRKTYRARRQRLALLSRMRRRRWNY